MTGYDEAVPAGRDLTANDVRDALGEWNAFLHRDYAEGVAEGLSRIARPSGGDGPRSWSLPAPPPDDVTEALDYFAREIDAFAYPEVARAARLHAAALSRWLLSVVEGEPPAPESEYAVSNWVRVPTTDGDTVTVGAPALDRRPHPESRWDTRTETWEPAPEPQAVESASVILFKDTGKYYTEESWRIPDGAIGPYDMERSPDFRRIGGGAVLVETQEPWGFPHLFPGVAAAGAERVEGR